MGLNAAQGAGIFGAIKDAIGSYMGLRQQKFDNNRQLGADARSAQQLQLQQDQLNQVIANQGQNAKLAQESAERDALQFVLQNFGGSGASEETFQKAQTLGMGDAIEKSPLATSPTNHFAGVVSPGGRPALNAEFSGFQPETPYQIKENPNNRINQLLLQNRLNMERDSANNAARMDRADRAARASQIRAEIMARAQQYRGDASQDMAIWNTMVQMAETLADQPKEVMEANLARLRAMPLPILFQMLQSGDAQIPPPLTTQPPNYPLPPVTGGTGGRFTPLPNQ